MDVSNALFRSSTSNTLTAIKRRRNHHRDHLWLLTIRAAILQPRLCQAVHHHLPDPLQQVLWQPRPSQQRQTLGPTHARARAQARTQTPGSIRSEVLRNDVVGNENQRFRNRKRVGTTSPHPDGDDNGRKSREAPHKRLRHLEYEQQLHRQDDQRRTVCVDHRCESWQWTTRRRSYFQAFQHA